MRNEMLAAAAGLVVLSQTLGMAIEPLRPTAVPLVACDPYFSIWSPADRLTDADTVHWTGKKHRLTSLVRIDGKAYRVMGTTPAGIPAMEQKQVEVLPTRTVYKFEGAGVALDLTFMSPTLPYDIDILSRPVTYVTFSLRATDGRSHEVAAYLDASAELAVNMGAEAVNIERISGGLAALRAGSVEQSVLGKRGDDIRIDWGYLYLAAPAQGSVQAEFGNRGSIQAGFAENGRLPRNGDSAGAGESACLALVLPAVRVGTATVSKWLMIAYDDLYSIQYMKKNLRPYWRRTGWEAADLLRASAKDYDSLVKQCEKFDRELMDDLIRAGGEEYARICSLAYRQCFAAGKFVADENGQPLQFCKENHSNGCIGTSDVFYPMAPQFLMFGPSVTKAFLVPFMNYAASPRWRFPFAPHDLGQYPKANGQVYGGGERTEENQMPVEETGNLMILMGAVAEMEGNATFASLYWPQLTKWAEYLKAKGFDPENQLCTDDFAGHLAHNVNLSAKAICGLASYGKLCRMRGDKAQGDEYFNLAREFAARWVKEADDGEKFRLAFDRPGTWSQKYNLIWDRILELNVFPGEVVRKEMEFYKKSQNKYGLPLDNRKAYTKLDWILWTATLTEDRGDFETLVSPVYRFLNETQNRSPMTDWYQTVDAKKVGFTARPVVGGVFARMLYEKPVWKKYASRDVTKAAGWAPIPEPPQIERIVPAADSEPGTWRYTTSAPGGNWHMPAFDASGWSEGKGGFGTRGTPGAVIGTTWNTPEIWLRRQVNITQLDAENIQAWIHHDEGVEVYINGVLAAKAGGFTSDYDAMPLTGPGKAALKPGSNIIAVHCRQTSGGQYIDVGFVSLK